MFTQSEDRVYFASVGLTLSVNEIYRNVRWSEGQPTSDVPA
jgi:hypothetical protein